MDQTTQFYLDQAAFMLGNDPEAAAAISALQSQLTAIAARAVAYTPDPELYARYAADKFLVNTINAQVVPELVKFGQLIGVDNPPPPPPQD